MKNKLLNPAIVFILGLITFGIANHFYIYAISKRIGKNSNGEFIYPMRETVLNIITFGIYGIIWTYRIANQVSGEKNTALLCAIISVFPIRCVSMAVIASKLD